MPEQQCHQLIIITTIVIGPRNTEDWTRLVYSVSWTTVQLTRLVFCLNFLSRVCELESTSQRAEQLEVRVRERRLEWRMDHRDN